VDTRVNPTAFGPMGAAVLTVLYLLMEDRRGGVLVYALFVSWAFVRLSGVARLTVPFTVRPGDRPDKPNAEWRYVDELRYPVVRIVTSAGWTWGQAMPCAPWLTG
jgi:hypothetical protein